MLTRREVLAACDALLVAESDHYEFYEWLCPGARWEGYQWNMVYHLVKDRMWEDLVYHLTHNLSGTHIRKEILAVLNQSAPRLCSELNLNLQEQTC